MEGRAIYLKCREQKRYSVFIPLLSEVHCLHHRSILVSQYYFAFIDTVLFFLDIVGIRWNGCFWYMLKIDFNGVDIRDIIIYGKSCLLSPLMIVLLIIDIHFNLAVNTQILVINRNAH
jgi:hypothetical protein